MEQRTCNIIMCCKGHCKLAGENAPPLEAIAAYMSAECACPKEDYTGKLMETILREALFDYMAGADKPGYELRQLLQQYATHDPDLSERIYTLSSRLPRSTKPKPLWNTTTISLPATTITVSTTNSSSPYLIWAGT